MAGCLAFLVGVLFATIAESNSEMIGGETPYHSATWALAGIGVLFVLVGPPKNAPFGSKRYLPVAVGIVLLGLALGIARTEQVLVKLEVQTVAQLGGERTTITGRVVDFPDTGLQRTRFTLEVGSDSREPKGGQTPKGRAASQGEASFAPKGRVRVTASRHQAPRKGDTVSVTGEVRVPESFKTEGGGTFNYPMFLAKDGITATMFATDTKMIESPTPYHPVVWLRTIREAVDEVSVSVLPYAEGAVLKAILIGDEGSMTEDFKDALNASGLRHIVAVSGMNIAIILSLIGTFMTWLNRPKRQVFLAALATVVFFVVLIGAPASAVRAGVMGLVLALAPLFGRQKSGMRAAIAAAAAMVFISPLILVYDAGFELSFLAVLGIILIGPLMMRLFRKLPYVLAETLAMTFAAQIAVVPLLLSTFGRVSLVAPLSNLVVVPAIMPVTIWGFAAVLSGIVWLPIGQLVALPMLPYFSLVRWVAETFAKLPVAEVALGGFAALGFATSWYAVVLWVIWRKRERKVRPIDLVPLYENIHRAE